MRNLALAVALALVATGCSALGSDDSTGGGETFVAATAPTPTTAAVAAAPTPDPTLRAHSTGTFEAAMPAGWTVSSTFFRGDPERPMLVSGPDLHPAKDAGNERLRVMRLEPGTTGIAFLDGLPAPSEPCTVSRQRSTRTVGSITVTTMSSTGCPTGLDGHTAVFQAANGDHVLASVSVRPGGDPSPMIDRAVETYGPGTTAATVADLYPCGGVELDPTGTKVVVVNYSGGPLTISGTQPNGSAVPETSVDPGRQGTVVVAPNAQVTIAVTAGEAVHTATSATLDCVMVTTDGIDHLRPPR